MARLIEIPPNHYRFLCNFFADETIMWDIIKDDIEQLRAWAKAIKELGWYNVDDKTKYEYRITGISVKDGVKGERRVGI